MRIAQVAPLAESVPPKLYGGTERVVSWLTDALVELGHDVTLFASGDSVTRAKHVPVWPRALRLSRSVSDPNAAQTALLEAVAASASEFDIIHCHIDWLHLPLLSRLGVPFLTTLHGRLDLFNLKNALKSFAATPFISISTSQRAPLPSLNWAGTVYHGMPEELLRPTFTQGQYLAFLGRITPEKGPHIAIRWARQAGIPIKIAAKIPRGETRFFHEEIKPHLDGKMVTFIGEVNDKTKEEFLGNAIALLFPINWPEPFGLAMIEAMACGTPTIAVRHGSVPEIIEDGLTGFVVDNEDDGMRAISRIGGLDRRSIRKEFSRRFTAKRMALDYLGHFASISSKGDMHEKTPVTKGALPYPTSPAMRNERLGDEVDQAAW